jgi:hypothetical protein
MSYTTSVSSVMHMFCLSWELHAVVTSVSEAVGSCVLLLPLSVRQLGAACCCYLCQLGRWELRAVVTSVS